MGLSGSDAYFGLGVFANGMWTFAAPTTGFTVPRNANANDITYLIESTGDVNASWNTNAILIDTNAPALLSGHDTNAIPAPVAASFVYTSPIRNRK